MAPQPLVRPRSPKVAREHPPPAGSCKFGRGLDVMSPESSLLALLRGTLLVCFRTQGLTFIGNPKR
ncbi:hypothetical protein MicloDRAFT_00003250 [Microvirga lotononidis]|uniref:Uncharacterized protein n=1 Tax=Microvirga lotononidis TaxID=864069 RepID=I4Z3K6_9HYPH|nr:hypothetical protein MicloDRAFT_00003250 [Microvirga lotononidis]